MVPASQVVALIQRTICMAWNVSEMISQLKHTKILQNIEISWCKYGVEDFSDAEDTLFGEDFRPLLLIRWRRRQPLLKQFPLPSVKKIIKGRTHLPVTERMVMVIAGFFEGALPTNTGTGRARISFRMAQSQRKREPFIRTIKHQGVRSRHAPYSTNLAYLPIRINKHPSTGSNNANPQWSFQPWTGHKSHQSIYVTGPAKIDHVSVNYTELYFC